MGSKKVKNKQLQNKKIAQFEKDNIHRKPPKWFYLVVFLIPLILIVLLEISLRVFNYGVDNHQWLPVTKEKYVLNPNIAYRWFYTTKGIPYSNQSSFDIVKKPNAFRVFVLGGSSGAGYPFLPNGSFSVYIKKRLQLLYPDIPIEVVNLSMSAINTYALRDMMPEVLEQKPDLILIYAGHNEYYGALGVGSMESLGTSRAVVNFVLWLNRFKTVELLRNIIKSISGVFSSTGNKNSGGTLMARMAKNQLISYNSDTYNKGIKQFEGNLKDILEMSKNAGVPVIIGTLTCNLKDQHPFVSVNQQNSPSANDVFKEAQNKLNSGNQKEAIQLFRKAKDLDALRFRAPGEINSFIINEARKYNYPVVQVDSAFNAVSPDGIVGNNLMTDHLHPTINGYKLLGKLFFRTMEKFNLLPKVKPLQIPESVQDSLTFRNYHFSKLDSTIGNFRIASLKNDWPFIKAGEKKPVKQIISLKNYIDTLAIQVVEGNLDWEKAHMDLSLWYLHHKRYKDFSDEVLVLSDQFPFIREYSDFAAKELLNLKQFDIALIHLSTIYKNYPDAFSAKWIGIINLSHNKTDEAIKYLESSLNYYGRDPQVLYNLAGAYTYKKQYEKALNAINSCLLYNPGYRPALEMKSQISTISRN